MKIDLRTLDRKMWRKEKLSVLLWKAHYLNENVEIDMMPEGSCATALRLYSMLDDFCGESGYSKENIRIKTGNLLESHTEYKIIKNTLRLAKYLSHLTRKKIILVSSISNLENLDKRVFYNKNSSNIGYASSFFKLFEIT